jgi:hypothetical protein
MGQTSVVAGIARQGTPLSKNGAIHPMSTYQHFLQTKLQRAMPDGFDVDPDDLNPALFHYQRDIVRWAVKKGRCAIFAMTGMGKSLCQLEWARIISELTFGRVLILAPLAVSSQTVAEGAKFGIRVTLCRDPSDVRDGINILNYELLEKFDHTQFSAIVLDESSILRAFDGKTRMYLTEAFRTTPYRLCCSATPAPNDHMELGTHAEFLGVMTRAEMLAMYFVHDGARTSQWRVKGHAKSLFWEWVASWATMITKPSDLGYSDEGFDLPPLTIHPIVTPSVQQGLPGAGLDLMERKRVRAASIEQRCQAAADLVNGSPDRPWILWGDLNDETALLTKLIPGAVEIKGSDKPSYKEQTMLDFVAGKVPVLVSKSSICGFGMNFQCCNKMAFVGLSDSFQNYFQAIRRCYRFGQTKPVDAYVITSEAEGPIVDNIKRKEMEFAEMQEQMISKTQELTKQNIRDVTSIKSPYQTETRRGKAWTMHLGDCVEMVKHIEDASVDYSIFSPPFASLYTYSDSERDMGNCVSDEQFFEHMKFLAVELMRTLVPGRLISFHCMNLPTTKCRDGFIGIKDFRGDLIRMFQAAGFIYHSEVCIWKNPVTAMQRTKALGLLHKQLKKDAAMCRQGIPDYLVTMRKPGDNPKRVTNTNETFPVSEWQEYASPVWMDINPSATLQKKSARAEEDERHICPLQLPVVERALRLWTAPGDVVLSPFAGIGSEGYVSLQMKRRFIGIELKRSYFDQAVLNLSQAEDDAKERLLFAPPEPKGPAVLFERAPETSIEG